MDFEITVEDDVRVFEQYTHALNYLNQKISAWNNFEPEKTLYIQIKKISGQTEALGVNVKEDINLKELFGQP